MHSKFKVYNVSPKIRLRMQTDDTFKRGTGNIKLKHWRL